jgi:hypothetical protein
VAELAILIYRTDMSGRNKSLEFETQLKLGILIYLFCRDVMFYIYILDDLKERRGYSHLKEEALDCTMWRARFGPVVRQTTK